MGETDMMEETTLEAQLDLSSHTFMKIPDPDVFEYTSVVEQDPTRQIEHEEVPPLNEDAKDKTSHFSKASRPRRIRNGRKRTIAENDKYFPPVFRTSKLQVSRKRVKSVLDSKRLTKALNMELTALDTGYMSDIEDHILTDGEGDLEEAVENYPHGQMVWAPFRNASSIVYHEAVVVRPGKRYVNSSLRIDFTLPIAVSSNRSLHLNGVPVLFLIKNKAHWDIIHEKFIKFDPPKDHCFPPLEELQNIPNLDGATGKSNSCSNTALVQSVVNFMVFCGFCATKK